MIPTLNEEAELATTLHLLRARAIRAPHIIVVDGGSSDETARIARRHRATVHTVGGGRGAQLRHGAACTTTGQLLFLHADTHVPRAYDVFIAHTLGQPHTSLGAFPLGIRDANWALRVVQWGANIRSRVLQRPYGDQGLFLRRATLDAVGGYPNQPFLDDYELVLRVARHGRIRVANSPPVLTSARRWRKKGILRTTVLNQCIIVGYKLGVPLDRLARWYRGVSAHS